MSTHRLDLNQPLTEKETVTLNRFLKQAAKAKQSDLLPSDIIELHGYLCATASKSRSSPPKEWLIPWSHCIEIDRHTTQKEAAYFIRFYNQIVHAFQKDQQPDAKFYPAHTDWVKKGLNFEKLKQWSTFYLIVAESDGRWTANDRLFNLLFPFSVLAEAIDIARAFLDKQPEDAAEEITKIKTKLAQSLNAVVQFNYRYWRRHRYNAVDVPSWISQTYISARELVELCFCGSGKSYSQCCLYVHPTVQ